MIPNGKQFIDNDDIQEVVQTLKSNYLTQGPRVSEFEKKIAKYCGSKYAVAVSNGTSALHLTYLVANLKKDTEVITTPNTFVATANMLLTVGAKPIFCDIRLDTFNIDENKIEKLIAKNTKVIVPVHFAGQPCEMQKIKKIAKQHKLLVIEDACHALGAKYKNNKIGNCKYSDMTVFSFHPVKPITTGEGGIITTNNKQYYKKLLSLRNHGIHKDKSGKNVMTELGYNYRLTDIQASLGISQLKKLDYFIKKRHQIVNWYKNELKNIEDIIFPAELPNNYSGWHLYIIRLKNSHRRDKLSRHLKNKKIGVNFHYPAVYSHPFYKQLGYKIKLENMEKYQNACLTLPCHTLLQKKDIEYIGKSIKSFLSK